MTTLAEWLKTKLEPRPMAENTWIDRLESRWPRATSAAVVLSFLGMLALCAALALRELGR